MELTTLNTDEIQWTNAQCIAEAIQVNRPIVLLDSRPSTDFNVSHILKAINLGGDEAFRRKFSQNRVPMDKLLLKLLGSQDESSWQSVPIVVYDHDLDDISQLKPDCFMYRLLHDLLRSFVPIYVLKGGFVCFRAECSKLCWFGQELGPNEGTSTRSDPTTCELERLLDECLRETVSQTIGGGALSRPGAVVHPEPDSSSSTTRTLGTTTWAVSREFPFPEVPAHPSTILPHVTIGSRADALNQTLYGQHGFTHVLNVSIDCPTSPHVPPERFMRIPILDNHTALILPHLNEAFRFIDGAKETQGQVLVHCAAGISRSPTVVIAYLMYSKRMQMRDAYEFVRSKRSSIAPNFNFLGQLLELNSQLFPSSSPGQSVTGLGEPMPTQQAKHLESHRSGPMDPSCKPPTGLPSPILSASPKHVGTKKRERPTFFSMKVPPYGGSEFARPFGGAHSSQPSPTESHMVGSPSEGKRSRVSLFNPSSAWTTSEQLLPSPCTEISQLHLSSPSDPHRGLAQTLVLQPSMDSLHYEPCSVGGSGETASSILSSTNGRWRRSLTSLGMSGVSPGPIRPTLLAERRVSSQQSAPSTPSRFTSEQLWHRGGLQLNLPSPGSVAPSQTSSVPFTRDYSPIAERSTEPPTEHHELQQCAFQSSPSNSLGAVMNFGLNRLSELPDCQHSGRPTDSSPVLCNLRLSQSAPSCSRSFCWPVGQELSHTANRSDGTTVESPFLVVLQSSILWNPPWSSLTRLRTHALGLELSCRQEETLSQCVPAELCLPCSHIVRSSLSASTGNLCTRTLAAL